MTKTSIGELKLSPIKEEGRFVFYNDFITINGKVSKGDKVKIFVDAFNPQNGKHVINAVNPSKALLVVRGQQHEHVDSDACATIEDLYQKVTEVYKDKFYFGNK